MNSIIKLTNGETIIAEIVHDDETTTNVLEPLALEIAESESGKPMMVALTWVPLLKRTTMVTLRTNHIVAVADVDEEMDLYYRKSLAVLKNDAEALKEIILEEQISESDYSYDSDIEDMDMDAFGQLPKVSANNSANTVH